jgi:hypothetical protein
MAHDGKTEDDDTTRTLGMQRLRTVTLQVALAKQDTEQAQVIRAWADELDAARKDGCAPMAVRVEAVAAKMRATADTVETYATALLERLERGT